MIEQSTNLEMASGDEQVVRLSGLGSAGYHWRYTLEGDERAVEVSISRSQPARTAAGGGPPPSNFNLDEHVSIRALDPGNVKIVCTQARAWEDASPHARHVISVTVHTSPDL